MDSEHDGVDERTTRRSRRRMKTVSQWLLKEGWPSLKRLTVDMGLWANPGGRFSDLSDVQAKLAMSRAIRKHSVLPVELPDVVQGAEIHQLITPLCSRANMARDIGVQTYKARDQRSLFEQSPAFADTALTVVLQPLLHGCEALEKLGEIPLSTQFSRIVVQLMLHILVLISQIPQPRWQLRKA